MNVVAKSQQQVYRRHINIDTRERFVTEIPSCLPPPLKALLYFTSPDICSTLRVCCRDTLIVYLYSCFNSSRIFSQNCFENEVPFSIITWAELFILKIVFYKTVPNNNQQPTDRLYFGEEVRTSSYLFLLSLGPMALHVTSEAQRSGLVSKCAQCKLENRKWDVYKYNLPLYSTFLISVKYYQSLVI